MDKMVLQTQKWLNKTYGNVKGYDIVKENGKTGWPTIYSLIEGLQHELKGIDPLTQSFGSKTAGKFEAYFNGKIKTNIDNATKVDNVVQLIQGAFWCKGINPGTFDGIYRTSTAQAIGELISDAGFDDRGSVSPALWGKALFDMAAFVNIGDDTIREMQQWLNRNYYDYFGLMPCDGIYQRDTNTALIYALQAEEGLDVYTANGAYGPTTTRLTPYLQIGDSGNFVKILQYGLYVNGFNQSKTFDGHYTNQTETDVLAFSKFMVLLGNKPSYGAGLAVMKGLLSSSGDTNRPATGADTSWQLSPEQIQTLVENDVHIIGRYLTGSAGSTANGDKHDKFLTLSELKNLFDADISVFPIYQDDQGTLDHFTASQGGSDAEKAGKAAARLNIPIGTVIYFAVDVDVLGDDIPGTVLPYFGKVHAKLTSLGYRVGIYGTRNVCTQVINAGFASFAFVSDMSTGYSGNLGFPMPQAWAFDQFIEFTIGSGAGAVGIDNVAVSGRDKGFNHFGDGTKLPIFQKVIEFGNAVPGLAAPAIETVEFEQEFMVDTGAYHIYTKLTESWSSSDDKLKVIKISNGKIESNYINGFHSFYDTIKMPLGGQRLDALSKLATEVYDGNIIVSPQRHTGEASPGALMKIQGKVTLSNGNEQEIEWQVEIYPQLFAFVKAGATDDQYANIERVLNATTSMISNSIRSMETFLEMVGQSLNQPDETLEKVAPYIILIATFMFVLAFP